MKSYSLILATVAVLAPVTSMHAEDIDMAKYLTVGSVEVTEVDSSGVRLFSDIGAPRDEAPGADFGLGDLNEADLIIDKIINMGKKVWAIVEAGKPVVDVKVDVANALPEGLKSWQQL